MAQGGLSIEDLIRENRALRNEIELLRGNQPVDGFHKEATDNTIRNERNFQSINEHLLNMGASFEENINYLTRLCGELTGATCTLYNRLENGLLCSAGQWNTPPGFCSTVNPEGHICFDVITRGSNQVVVVYDLPNTPYAQSDPNVSAYNLITYMGKAIVSNGRVIGSLCAVFQKDVRLTLEHEQIFTLIGSILGSEESRKADQEVLRESEERFRSAFMTSPDSININRLSDGMFIDINEGFTNITGYTREEAIGKTSIEMNIWDDPADRARLVEGLSKNGYVENLEARFRMKDGGTKTALMSARVFMIKGVPHILSVTRDMTDWKKAMLAVQESENKFRSVVENAFDGIYLISGNRFTYCNHRFSEIMGYSMDEMMSEQFNFATTLTDKSRELIEQRRQARILGEEIPGIYEFEIQTKTGEIKEVEVSTVGLGSSGVVNVLGIMRDVTERKKLFEELVKARDKAEEVNKLKSRLLANLSHEIRTPLNGILGFAELLREDAVNESQHSMADIIFTSGYRLLHTLNAILDLSVIESRFSKLTMREVNLNQVSNEVASLFKPNAKKKGIGISINPAKKPLIVKADEELISKILNNLINNAIKFTHEGSIEVTTCLIKRANLRFGCVKVTDTGIGIREEHHDIIFDEFRQVSEGQARHYDGSGLGLHISKRFTEMMGGTLEVTSQPGSGSTFTLCLPLKSLPD